MTFPALPGSRQAGLRPSTWATLEDAVGWIGRRRAGGDRPSGALPPRQRRDEHPLEKFCDLGATCRGSCGANDGGQAVLAFARLACKYGLLAPGHPISTAPEDSPLSTWAGLAAARPHGWTAWPSHPFLNHGPIFPYIPNNQPRLDQAGRGDHAQGASSPFPPIPGLRPRRLTGDKALARIRRIRGVVDERHHFTLICRDLPTWATHAGRQQPVPAAQGDHPGALHLHPRRHQGAAAPGAPPQAQGHRPAGARPSGGGGPARRAGRAHAELHPAAARRDEAPLTDAERSASASRRRST